MKAEIKRVGLEGVPNLVWKLRRPLYGLSISGKLWENYLKESLGKLGWTPIPEWPQTFKKVRPGTGHVALRTLVLTAYVDDMAMGGVSSHAHKLEWKLIQATIKCSDPLPLDRILGVEYSFHRREKECEYLANMDLSLIHISEPTRPY